MDPLYKYVPTGALLTQVAYANYLARGVPRSDLVGCNEDGSVIGEAPPEAAASPTPSVEESPAPVEEPPVPPEPTTAPLLDLESYYKRDLVAVCERLGLDDNGTKTAIIKRLSAVASEDVAAALDALGCQPHD